MADPPTRDDHSYILRNCIANFYCSTIPFHEIIGMVWKNELNQTLGDYLNTFSITEYVGGSQKNEKKWREVNEKKLLQTSLESFDITFLYQILPMICREKIVKFGTSEHEKKLKDKTTVEWHLKEIKDMRNSFSHEPKNISEKDFFAKLKDLIHNCLIAACTLYGITNKAEIDQITIRADDKFTSIIRKITNDRESRVIFLKDFILSDCIELLKERLNNMKISLPGNTAVKIELNKVFQNVSLTIATRNMERIQYHSLFAKTLKDFTIVEATAGSGKSTLMKKLYWAIMLGEQSNFESSKTIQLALPISCQTDNYIHLGEYCKALFPKPFAGFDKNEVLDSIRLIDGVLFLIDGFDEANEQTRTLTNSAIEFCRNGENAYCIISSRIKAANELKTDLSNRGLEYDVMYIQKMDVQKDQIELIRKYAAQIPNVNEEEAVEKFQNLNQKVKNVFNTPFLLAFFCTLYKTLVNESQLINEVDVFRGIYKQIFDGIFRKLSRDGVSDSAHTIMKIICEHSLHLIALGKTVFNTEQYEQVKESCKRICPSVRDMDNVLENVLIPEISDCTLDDNKYSFFHLSIHEYFSSLAIEMRLKRFDSTVISKEQFIGFLDLSPHSLKSKLERYLNVFRFLILRLHSTVEFDKICVAMSDIMANYVQPDYTFCFDLISDTECSNKIIKMMSLAVASHSSFVIEGHKHLRALVEALFYAQNKAKEGTKNRKIGLSKSLALDMKKSHYHYKVLGDDIFEKLKKIKCSITLFRGCLVTDFSLGVLASKLLSNSSYLYISCPNAKSHNLKILDREAFYLDFTFKLCPNVTTGDRKPLPRNINGDAPSLHITDIPAHSQENVYKMLCSLAPKDSANDSRTFNDLYLARCSLSASEVKEVVQKLSVKKYTTENEGVTRALKLSSGRNEYCDACRDNHTEEDITCFQLKLSKSQYVHHLDKICAADFSEIVIKQEEHAVKKFSVFEVTSTNHLIALSKVLNCSQQLLAHSSEVDGHGTKLEKKSEQTKEISIKLWDSFRNFQPLSDDIFHDLKSVRCSISVFYGCLESNISLNILKSKLTRGSDVKISTTSVKNHQLNILNGIHTGYIINFAFKFENVSLDDSSSPLPRQFNGWPPLLRVTDSPTNSQEIVCRIISILAPRDSSKNSYTFSWLYLARCSLSASEVNDLVEKLSAKKFTTRNEGVTRALKLSSGRNEYCNACRDNHSEEDITCYQLVLSKQDRNLLSSKDENLSSTTNDKGKKSKLLNYLERKMKRQP